MKESYRQAGAPGSVATSAAGFRCASVFASLERTFVARTSRRLSLILIVGALLTACGSDSGSSSDSTDPGFDNTDPGTGITDPGTDPTDPGTDPTDPGSDSDPDTTPPVLELTAPANTEGDATTVILSGTVYDPEQQGTGVASVWAESAEYPDLRFEPVIDGNNFNVEVPVRPGLNDLTVHAEDLSGNRTSEHLTWRRITLPQFSDVTPAHGTVTVAERVTLIGTVYDDFLQDDLALRLGDQHVVLEPTANEFTYRFEIRDLPLVLGDNHFLLRADNAYGHTIRALRLTRSVTDAEDRAPPKLQILAPGDGQTISQTAFRLRGEVISEGGPVTVTVNGEVMNQPSHAPEQYQFSTLLSFPQAADTLDIFLVAEDALGRRTTQQASVYRDNSPPELVLFGLAPLPAINEVAESPLRIRGIARDNNLSGVMLEGETLPVQPGAEAGEYVFDVLVPMPVGTERDLTFTAHDRLGNRTSATYRLQSVLQVNLTPVLPEANERFSRHEGETISVAVRAEPLPEGIEITAGFAAEDTTVLTVQGIVATGQVLLPATHGAHELAFHAIDAEGNQLATTVLPLEVVDIADTVLELERHEPANNARRVDPNQALQLHFNRPVNPDELEVTVLETLHGRTYANLDQPGLDFLGTEGYQLVDVHRDRVPVPGELDTLPGGTSLVFYPDRYFGFGGQIEVVVAQGDHRLGRFRFDVRPLPTFISGSLIDPFGQPLANVDVALPELGRSTRTDGDGAFSFGFGDPADRMIPPGRHQLAINAGFATPGLGMELKRISLEAGRHNQLNRIRVPELTRNTAFQHVHSAQDEASLMDDDLRLDLRQADLLFANGRLGGNLHAQFEPLGQFTAAIMPGIYPQWLYAMQPRGVVVEGNLGITLQVPQLNQRHDHLPPEGTLVALVGYDPDREVIKPVGVGEIQGTKVHSIGTTHVPTLDYIGYSLLPAAHQPLLRAIADGDSELQQLMMVLN